MIYQLVKFDKWARKDIHPEVLLLQPDQNKLKENIDFATSEKETICSYFRDKAIGKLPEPTTKFIQAHQVGISTITDIIAGYIHNQEYNLPPELKTFYTKVCLLFEEIILFIQQHLSEYFNTDLPITYINTKQSKADIEKQLLALHPILQNPTMDKALFRMVLRPFRHFTDEDKRINYRELSYLKELTRNLKELLDMDNDADITCELHLILLQLNFNFPRFVLHYNYWLDAKISEISDRAKRLDKLSWYINSIEQMSFNPDLVLNPKLPPLKDQLLHSIKNTYQYLLTEDKLANHIVVNQISPKQKKKIRLSISVPVLALFIKLFIKAGIIINKNRSEVFQIITENFTTLKSERISYGSLKKKYNRIPPAAYLFVQKTFGKMAELLREV
jgi:hypothetical protein